MNEVQRGSYQDFLQRFNKRLEAAGMMPTLETEEFAKLSFIAMATRQEIEKEIMEEHKEKYQKELQEKQNKLKTPKIYTGRPGRLQ